MILGELGAAEPPLDWNMVAGAQMRAEHPDAHFGIEDEGTLRACCSVWWRDAPPLAGERVGVLGHFGASDAVSATALLETACARLTAEGCTVAVGPMDGNSWRRYRLVTYAGTEPVFLLEPMNPPSWPAFFAAARFETLATYRSLVSSDLTTPDPRAALREPELSDNGIVIRPLDITQFDDELKRIYSVARVAFSDNLLYTPLPEAEFAAQYQKVKSLLDPELVLVAMDGSHTVGFAFGIPDPARAAVAGRTVIVKTLAILPDRERYSGLGRVLAAHLHSAAHLRGYTRAIHALIQDENHSLAISERTATVMRRYALYIRRLSA